MTSLVFPDVNVWLALLMGSHVHRDSAIHWWRTERSAAIAFLRFTQIGVLRLLTTSAAMNGNPLTMGDAWAVYDRLFEDDRVTWIEEPFGLDPAFRLHTSGGFASPKLWADAYLLAMAETCNAHLCTFDAALAARSSRTVLLA